MSRIEVGLEYLDKGSRIFWIDKLDLTAYPQTTWQVRTEKYSWEEIERERRR